MHFDKLCTAVERAPSGRTLMRFADGSTHETDVVVGADGIKSTVRAAVLGPEAAARVVVNTNTVAYRALVPVARLKAAGVDPAVLSSPRCWLGDGQHMITLQMRNATLLNIAAITTDFSHPMQPAGARADWASWVGAATKEELLAAFAGWGPAAQGILRCIDAPTKWAIHCLYPPLRRFARGSTVLVGDAAHGMLPHLGSGAGVGIEDAYVLAQLLSHPQTTRENIETVLKAYDAVRVPRAAFVAEASKIAGEVYKGHGPSGNTDEGLRADLDLQWAKVWFHSIDDEIHEAERILVDTGAFNVA